MSLDFMLIDPEQDFPENDVYSANITHNVAPMWRRAGVYEALYKSEGKKAGEIVPTLKAGLALMIDNRADFEALNPKNGWGDYAGAMRWLLDVTVMCERYPDAVINVWA